MSSPLTSLCRTVGALDGIVVQGDVRVRGERLVGLVCKVHKTTVSLCFMEMGYDGGGGTGWLRVAA